jgi:hypothetical protein
VWLGPSSRTSPSALLRERERERERENGMYNKALAMTNPTTTVARIL